MFTESRIPLLKKLESEKASFFFCVGVKALSTQKCFLQATKRERDIYIEREIESVGALSTPMSGKRSSGKRNHVLVDHVRLSCQNYEKNGCEGGKGNKLGHA